MLFDIVNFSDPYTMESDRLDIAVVTVLLLGRGSYGLTGIDSEYEVPIFSFGNEEYTSKWLQENCGFGIEDLWGFVDTHKDELAACLESVVIGSPAARQEYADTLTKKLAGIDENEWQSVADFKAQWHDQHRSSMNDIGSHARALAKKMREQNGN